MIKLKKLALILIFLLNAPFVYANQVSLGTVSADGAVTSINANFTVIGNVLNGVVEGSTDSGVTVSNIKADSVFEINMADDANGRVRDSELFNITTDSVSGGTLTQGALVESGCLPADDTDLTSDVSACVAYVNGYRVSKAATATTYIATRDNYLDLSQTGVYTVTAVTNGAVQPSVAANSVRLAKVVTNGSEITAVTSLYTTRVPGLVIPSHYRVGMNVSRDSTTTITVQPGSCEVNSTILSKAAITTLTLTTAADWAGGSSLQAVSTYGYVGIDSSGNLRMHTTAPTHDNYAVSTTVGKRRYATWSSTVYRILGWFFMNATGSGELNTYEVSNIAEGDVANSTYLSSNTNVNSASGTFVNDTEAVARFYSSGGPLEVIYNVGGGAAGTNRALIQISVDSTGIAAVERMGPAQQSVTGDLREITAVYRNTATQAGHTVQGQFRDVNAGDTQHINKRSLEITEKA